MDRRMHVVLISALGVLTTALIGASLAWACVGTGNGLPSSVNTPGAGSPSSGGGGPTTDGGSAPGASASGTVSGAPSHSSSASDSGSSSGSSSASNPGSEATGSFSGSGRSAPINGARHGGGAGYRGASRPDARGGGVVPSGSSVAAQFAARVRGQTAGVSTVGGRAVFASSIAPKAKGGLKAAAASGRGGLGDPWSGLDSSAGSPGSGSGAQSAEPATASGGLGSTIGVGIAILGVGLAGLFASFLVAGVRRRRAQAPAGR